VSAISAWLASEAAPRRRPARRTSVARRCRWPAARRRSAAMMRRSFRAAALAGPADRRCADRLAARRTHRLENAAGLGATRAEHRTRRLPGRAGDCAACHTARGGAAYAGGRAVDTPFGRVMAPNITPDRDTGIGAWTADDFWNALHNGKSRDGRLLYPAFPYPNYTKVTRDDADALFAFCAACRRRASRTSRTPCASPTTARRRWRLAPALLQAGRVRSRSRRAAPTGTAAPTWSRAWATAPPATARATSWARAARDCTAAG
jgi:hypothetical protein